MADQPETTKKKKGSIASRALHGRWVSTRFFGRHWGLILAAVVMILIYIANRYQCLTAMETIQSLEKELLVVKTERIRAKSRYMSNIRESSMQHLIDSLKLDLKVGQRPPFKITYDK